MAVIEQAAATALAVTLGLAAIGKLTSDEELRYRLLALIELVVAAGLLAPFVRQIALVLALSLAIGFMAYAIGDQSETCQCFGARMPRTSRTGRLVRNGMILGLAFAGLGASLMPVGETLPLTGLALGAVTAAVVVGLPWILWPLRSSNRA